MARGNFSQKKGLLLLVAFFSFALFSSSPAFAGHDDIYIAEAAQGGGGGGSCASANPVSWFNSAANWSTLVAADGKIGPGDTVHVCGTVTEPLFIKGSGQSGLPITIYFEPNAKMSAPTWTGPWWGVQGAIRVIGANYITLDGGQNGIIEATDDGTNMQHVNSVGILVGGNNVEVKNFTIQNLYVRTDTTAEDGNSTGIYFGGGSNNSIHDNRISNAQRGIGYSYPSKSSISNVSIYNNTISGINWGIGVGDSDTYAHADNVQIYSNDIKDTYQWDDPKDNFHHDGIFVFAVHTGSSVTNLEIFGNYIHGKWGVHTTAWIFMQYYSTDTIPGALIYNNVLSQDVGSGRAANGFITTSGSPIILNNTIVGVTGGLGINTGQGAQVQNNLIYQLGTGQYSMCEPIGIHVPDMNTFSASDKAAINNNLYYCTGTLSPATFNQFGNGLTYTFSKWQGLGLDLNTISADPLFVNFGGNDYHLQGASPAIGKGVNFSNYFTTDKQGKPRPQSGAWAIGAYEPQSASSPPATPPQLYSVTVSNSGNGAITSNDGAISCGTSCSESLANGASLTLTESPASGYAFAGWGGACDGNSSACTITVNSNATITAQFVTTANQPAQVNCQTCTNDCVACANTANAQTPPSPPSVAAGSAQNAPSGGNAAPQGTGGSPVAIVHPVSIAPNIAIVPPISVNPNPSPAAQNPKFFLRKSKDSVLGSIATMKLSLSSIQSTSKNEAVYFRFIGNAAIAGKFSEISDLAGRAVSSTDQLRQLVQGIDFSQEISQDNQAKFLSIALNLKQETDSIREKAKEAQP